MQPDIASAEELAEYDVTWPWHHDELVPGLTAVLRVRNESRNLPWVLPPILRSVDSAVLIDNNSDDGTAELARRVADDAGLGDQLTITSYPFQVSRCGPEHLETRANSVHSLTHYYNWAFSHVATTYSMKWDGDMVLSPEAETVLADLSWQLSSTEVIVRMPYNALYVASDSVGYLDLGMTPSEPWIYPMGPRYTYLKAFDWELRAFPDSVERIDLPAGMCVELKWLDSNEFDHWTDTESMDSPRAGRKQREWKVFTACAAGRAREISGVERIEAPAGVHIVDYVTQTWLPNAR